MRNFLLISLLMFFTATFGQYKNDISVVQFTAEFVTSASLKEFSKHNTYTFFIEEESDKFDKENISFVPTIILYHNGKEIKRIESNIMLELPKEWKKEILEEVEAITSQKF